MFHELDATLPDFNDTELSTHFQINQSRLDDITLKEDIGFESGGLAFGGDFGVRRPISASSRMTSVRTPVTPLATSAMVDRCWEASILVKWRRLVPRVETAHCSARKLVEAPFSERETRTADLRLADSSTTTSEELM